MSIKVKNIILRDETPFELDNEVILKNVVVSDGEKKDKQN